MRCICLPLVLLTSCLFLLTPPLTARPPAKEALVDRVRLAIDRGVDYLKNAEKGRGHWDYDAKYPGGQTALAMLALLTAGVDPKDPLIQKGLAHLRKIPVDQSSQTYVVGLQIMVYAQVFSLTRDPVDKERIQAGADWLAKAHQANGWGYRQNGEPDNSNTQYALLGLHEARLAGANVDPRLLEDIRKNYVATQTQEGGWIYRRGQNEVTMTMTTAGLCGLLISDKEMERGHQNLKPDGSDPNCGIYADDQHVADALNWIGNAFPSKLTRDEAARWVSPFYALYGLERAGRLSGQRFFGGHDWYRVGCEYLVETQSRDGSWSPSGTNGQMDDHSIVPTCFALLFLAKGRTPVLITKLAHNPGPGWNNKRSDVRHLVEFAARELFKSQPLGWQVFDIRNRDAADESSTSLASELLASPLLWFNGHDFAPRDRDREVVKAYLDNGGFVFAEACCGREKFDTDFRKMVTAFYGDKALVEVPIDHPVWSASGRFVSNPRDFPLYGVRQGCKWVLFYSPKPISGYWEANDAVSEQGKKAFEMGANIIAYATGLERPLPRLTEVVVARPSAEDKLRPGYLELAELAHDGDWSWPSKALVNVSTALRNDKIDVVLRPALVKLSPGVDVGDKADALLPNPDLAPVREISETHFFYLHGRRNFTYDDKTIEQMRYAMANNGLLLADAGCGALAFDAPFRAFVKKLWPEDKLEKIPITDRLYSKELNGLAIAKVKCRRRTAAGQPESEMREAEPELEGIKRNGRWVVIYSRYDLGCALQKHGSTDCVGHDYDSALRLARAAVLYALDR